MTNKQAYAGLLERLVARGPDYGRSANEVPALNNPDGPEAAEAISSLLTESAFLCARLREWENVCDSEECCREYSGHVSPSLARLENLIAALNSDAPLSVGEAQ